MAATESFTALFLSLRRNLARYVMRIVPPREVEDIVQETYVRVCQMQVDGGITSPRSYLYRTARNIALDHAKRSESRLAVGMDALEGDSGRCPLSPDDTFEQAASREEFAFFCEAVRQLPVQCRQAFVLRKVYGYSQREISLQMGLSESTVEKHIATGVKRCALFMRQSNRRACEPVATDKVRRARASRGSPRS